jgi:hypothetical protein
VCAACVTFWLPSTTLLACTFERTPSHATQASTSDVKTQSGGGSGSEERAAAGSNTSTQVATAPDAQVGDAQTSGDQLPADNMQQGSAGQAGPAATAGAAGAPEPPASQVSNADAGMTQDAGQQAPPATHAGSGPAPAIGTKLPEHCTRDALRERADAYLQAMATGKTESLSLHPAVRYTENGQEQLLGAGLWLTRPLTDFARHMLDEARCSSVSEAVLTDIQGRIVFGMRLLYVDDQLREVETHVVRSNLEYYDPDALIPTSADPWVVPIPPAMRMSRDALVGLAERYFDVATGGGELPPHTPACLRRQNGKLMPSQGSCGVSPGNSRFEQRRFPVVDETTGVVTACVVYRGYIGIYLFKAADNTLQNIDVVGGFLANTSGW